MIEEAYEAVDAIEAATSRIFAKSSAMCCCRWCCKARLPPMRASSPSTTCADINAKMIRRHPHVFGEAQAENANEVLGLWEQVKLAEKEAADAQAAEGERPQGAA